MLATIITIALALLIAPRASAQGTISPTDPMHQMSASEIKYFMDHFDKITLTGTVRVQRNGQAKIVFEDAEHANGFELPPSCDLKETMDNTHGLIRDQPAKIKQWGVTDSTEFTSFTARRDHLITYSCSGFMWKNGMKGTP